MHCVLRAPVRLPKKIDIDKMHAYRDAIRDLGDQPVVDSAAIVYPGPLANTVEASRHFPGIRAPRSC
jgi:predicted component of viral defense system (DUF524 family)